MGTHALQRLWQGPERNQGKDLLSDISFPMFQRLI